MSLLYTYKDVSDEELAENLRYLESENGRWLSRVVLKSLFAAMEDGARVQPSPESLVSVKKFELDLSLQSYVLFLGSGVLAPIAVAQTAGL